MLHRAVLSCEQGVSVPVQFDTPEVSQMQPWLEQLVESVKVLQGVRVPVHVLVDHVQPLCVPQLVESMNWPHGVTVPVHVPADHEQPPLHVADVVCVLQETGVPLHV